MRQDPTISKAGSRDYARDGNRIDLALGIKLKTLRHIANKTQSEIADFLDISPQQYQKYEKGSNKCSLQTLYRLASHYKINVAELLPCTTAMRGSGGHGTLLANTEQHTTHIEAPILDEAKALSELLVILLKIPSRDMRHKLLKTLLTLE